MAMCAVLTQFYLGFLLSLTTIGASAFENRARISLAGLPPRLISLGSYAFRNCAVLRTLTIGGSITAWGASVFAVTGGVTALEFPGTDLSKVNCEVRNPALTASVIVTAPHAIVLALCGHPISSQKPPAPMRIPDRPIPLAGWEIVLIVIDAGDRRRPGIAPLDQLPAEGCNAARQRPARNHTVEGILNFHLPFQRNFE
jgi:hypothetical protein